MSCGHRRHTMVVVVESEERQFSTGHLVQKSRDDAVVLCSEIINAWVKIVWGAHEWLVYEWLVYIMACNKLYILTYVLTLQWHQRSLMLDGGTSRQRCRRHPM